ncbi:glycine cleavage system protein R [Neptunomonas qingdaonensis]|uniref:Glycine cleavage system transcriptional repressor n=1 Tax=Neptunomonas qingdaonensis TaxID=1045558 RepID=A0A1I2VTQ3_9GAMM|nr:ACT domain-containing protein [Neptunomonas qingdaonensis]SFG90916.1 Glycine cleavage system regulatory protein [Neptunomonas qingdaonensis]
MTSLILTIIGPDKPGLVEHLSNTIAEHDGNWLESALSRLGGKFAGILVISVPEEKASDLTDALQALQKSGLKIIAETADEQERPSTLQAFTLELIGHDKPGIVREISQALAKRHINVENLTTELVSGSMSAELLFKAEAHLLAPDNIDLDDLQSAIEAIASDLMVDITLN